MSNIPDDSYFNKIIKFQQELPVIGVINMDPNLLKRQVNVYDETVLNGILNLINFIEKNEPLNSTYIFNRQIVINELEERKNFFRFTTKKHFPGSIIMASKN